MKFGHWNTGETGTYIPSVMDSHPLLTRSGGIATRSKHFLPLEARAGRESTNI